MFFQNYFNIVNKAISAIEVRDLQSVADKILKISNLGGKLIIVGNGGSANIAGHMAVDFTNAAKIEAISFNDPGLITCFSNDYGYENWVTRAMKSYAKENDLLITISSSGNSKNLVNASLLAKEMGLYNITFTGFDKNNRIRSIGDKNFWVDSNLYNVVEMTHHVWLVSIVDFLIEERKKRN